MTSPVHAVLGQARWAAAALATYQPDRVQHLVSAVAAAAAASDDADVRRLAQVCLESPGALTAGPQLDLSSGTQLLPSPVGVVVLLAPVDRPEVVVWHTALLAAANRDVLLVVAPEGSRLASVLTAAGEAGTAAGAPQGWLQGVAAGSRVDGDLVVVADEAGLGAASGCQPWVHAVPGPVPAWVTSTADVTAAANAVVDSRASAATSYHGSETVLLVDDAVRPQLIEALAAAGAAVLRPDERDQLGAVLQRGAASAVDLAAAAGIAVAASTRLLVVPVSQVVAEDPFVQPSLLPVLALLDVAGPQQGIESARAVTRLATGRGTAVVHSTDPLTAARLGAALRVSLLLVNQGVARPRTALEPTDLVRMTRVHDLELTAQADPAPLASSWAPGPVPPYPWASNDPRRL